VINSYSCHSSIRVIRDESEKIMDYVDQMKILRDEGQPFVLATVVRIEKPTSARPGAKAIITPDGALTGWIGGSCAEPTVLREAALALEDGQVRLLRLCPPEKMGLTPQEGVTEVKLTCMSGGTLDIYLEPHLPQPHLVVIGHHAAAQALAALAKDLEYTVTAAGEVSEERFPNADRRIETLDFTQIEFKPNMYVVVASHGNYDETALEAVLPSKAAYVALVASKKRAESVRTYLREAGLSEEHIARLKYPAGLDIGAATPAEIAVSILAEIVQLRRRGKPSATARRETETLKEKPHLAIDPVCGMSVNVATARFTAVHAGETFYFCSPRCKQQFEKDPQTYLSSAEKVHSEKMIPDQKKG
jgi:xanthine dehydrogenase accessory factor